MIKAGAKMRITNELKKIKRATAILAAIVLSFGSTAVQFSLNTVSASAAQNEDKSKDRLNLRMIFTTDLHGMLSSMDYLSGTDFKNAGLARANTLIQKTKSERNENNVFTFDVGDVLFEASMEYIYGQDEEAIQPIYQGMAMVGYDAITLGNHDFDYGRTYILNQLNDSGLMDKVVISNLKNTKYGDHPFQENMIIERQAVTEQGKTVTVKVGVIGETYPILSTKTDNYSGVWRTEDIVTNTKEEAAKLKEQGADIVVVLSHSGFGEEEPQEFDGNASYALTKIDDVDIVLCGHEHNEFPTANQSGNYYNYSGVDKSTNLVNGKVMVMAASQGKSIGVADIGLRYDEQGGFTIDHQAGHVRKVADYKLGEDKEILSCFDDWKDELSEYRTKELIKLADGVTLENYCGLLGDSPVLQLQNDARIAYARKYIESVATDYSGYPVIAAASHISYGVNSNDDYVNISGSVSFADLFTIQNYRNYTYLYKITGAQLREWIELSASAYTTLNAEGKDTQFLINSEWMNDWSKFYVFDGINYKISPYVEPRYNINGKRINSSNRVSGLTYNGIPVTDDMELIIACNTLNPSGNFSWAADAQVKGMYRTQNIIADYLRSLDKFGAYTPSADHNWTLELKEGQKFYMLLPKQAAKFAKAHEMYESTVVAMNDKTLYQFQTNKQTMNEPHVVALQSNLEPTNKGYEVYVDAFSSTGIKKMYYSPKLNDVNDRYWNDMYAYKIENNRFTVYYNSSYYIYVEDNAGKKMIYEVIVDNIGTEEMAAPKVWSFNNMKTAVTGKSEAGAQVYAVIDGKTYQKKANSDGSFSIQVPAQLSGTHFYVYAQDLSSKVEGEVKRKSPSTKVYVKSSGPNIVTVDEYYNNSQYLTGNKNDDTTMIVVVDETMRTVYVDQQSGKKALEGSIEVDFSKFNIVEVPQITDASGNFKVELPNIAVKTSLRVVNMDHIGRVGVSTYITVKEGGPYAPEFIQLLDSENVIYGKVESVTSNKKLTVVVNINNTMHTVTADKKGNFKLALNSPLAAGTKITAYARDSKNNTSRMSKITTGEVGVITDVKKSNAIRFATATAYNTKAFTIEYDSDTDISVAIPYTSGTQVKSVRTNSVGLCRINLDGEMAEGALVRVTKRNSLGELVAASYNLVTYRTPTTPVLLTKLTNSSTYMKILTKENCKLYVTIGAETIESKSGTYNLEQKGYVHIIKFDRLPSDSIVSMYAKNPTTESERLVVNVDKKAPDIPADLQVTTVTKGAIQITGQVELFLLNSTKEPTLKLTKTKVFAKANGVNYQGVVEEDGKFSIMLPAVKEDTICYVFAYNRYGYGPKQEMIIR